MRARALCLLLPIMLCLPFAATAATCTSTGGNWASAGIWSCGNVPANGDDVIINADTTLNTNSNTLSSLQINSTRTLTIGNNATGRTLTVTGGITVNGSLDLGNAAATHTLVAGSDIVNSGTINFRPSANRLCNVTFNRNGNQTVNGSGSFTFNLITLNMGASRNNVLDMQPAITVPSPFLTITNGTYRHSSPTNITPWTADPNIPASGGFWLNGAATVATAFNVTLNGGMLSVSSGVMNVGTTNGIRIILADAATTLLQMSGGALTVSGGINSASNTAAGTVTMNGGTMTLQTVNAGPLYTLLLGSSTTFNWSGGTIIAVNGNAATDDVDIRSSTQNITGGTMQIGSPTTTSANDISYINGAGGQLTTWNLVLAAGITKNILLRSSTNVLNDLTIQANNNLQPNGALTITVGAGNTSGDWISNGTFTRGTSIVTFTGTSATQSIGGTSATTFNNLVINKATNDLTLDISATVAGTLTFTSGDVITGTNTLISSANCPGGVSRTSGHVIGNLRLTFPATNPVTCVFHVGDANNYSPVSITKTGTNSGTLTASATAGDHADTTGGTSGIDSTKSVNRYWTVTAGTLATGTPYSAVFQFCSAVGTNCAVNDVDSGANTASFAVARKTSGTWSLTTVGTRTGTTTQATGLAAFGEFAVGEVTGSSVNAANFDCIETGLSFTPAVRHPLYTKLVGTAFTFDVVALKASGAIETSYVGSGSKTVTVELFDDTSTPQPACSAYAGSIATQTVTFGTTDNGRKTTGTFNVGAAYRKLRCRVTDTNVVPTVHGCSNDQFAMRPRQFTLSTTTALNPASNKLKAGANFNLTASAGVSGGYVTTAGTPTVDSSKIVDHDNIALASGTWTGGFAAATGTNAVGTFQYGEVGSFTLNSDAVIDATFTSIDIGATPADCIIGSASNTLSPSGHYGCDVGSTSLGPLGRFIPHHFTVAGVSFTPACSLGGTAFSYMDQPFPSPGFTATIEARNASDGKTLKYTGATYATAAVSVQIENANNGVPIANTRLTRAPGTGNWSNGAYDFAATTFTRLATVDGPYASLAIGVTVTDETALPAASRPYLINRDMDETNASCTADTSGFSDGTCTAATLTTMVERYGRFRMSNAFGSELLPLTMTARTEFYNGTGWVINTDDNCTTLNAAPTSPQPLNAGGSTTPSCAGVTACTPLAPMASGDLSLRLSAPNTAGFADITLDVPTWLEFPWLSATPSPPTGRATFGIYKGNQRLIYRRERY